MSDKPIQTTMFGQTGREVTRVGLGGEGILRTYGEIAGAQAVILEAVEQGIRYFDSARAYAGSEQYYGTIWPDYPDVRAKVFQASKSASRDRKGAFADLEKTLSSMGIEYLDLWQIHDVRSDADLRVIEGQGGALEAFTEAKASGKTRFIGVTGHHDPNVLARAVGNWPVDAVMMPVNPVEGVLGGFFDVTLTRAKERGIAVIGMKLLGASHYILPELKLTPELLISYGLSHEIDVAIVGCSSRQEVQTLASVGRASEPLTPEEQAKLVKRIAPFASRLAYYRGVI